MNNSKTFRLFISSTFSDFKKERQVLQEKVFPKINKYLQENYSDYTFQPIDLRWGVSEEAQHDQKTLELCLNEVRSCKQYLHPNFLIMSGNRYGWVPLPYAIASYEFNLLYNHLSQSSEEKLQNVTKYLDYWYKEDTNHLNKFSETHFVLQTRKDERNNTNISDKLFRQDFQILNSENKDYNIFWAEHEKIMRDGLQKAVKELIRKNKLPEDRERKYVTSATEAEVEEGIFQYLESTSAQKEMQEKQNNLSELDKEYLFAYLKNIHNIDYTSNKEIKGFHERLKDLLFDENIINLEEKENYLDNFVNQITEKIKISIKRQIDKQRQIIPNLQMLDFLEQKEFKHHKTKIFEGRKEEIEIVKNYIDRQTSQPLVIHGVSGIGKSAFMAKLTDVILHKIDKTKRDYPVYYRFVGATSASSNIRTLLESLINQLSDEDVFEKPEKYESDINKFNEQVKTLLEGIEKPVIIILDALDQLQVKDYLQWLPEKLPVNVKVILSVLDEGDTHYWKILKNRVDDVNRLELEKISDSNTKSILEQLLKVENRSLSPTQTKYVLEQVSKSGNSPLYLKIAFEEVKTWKSYDNEEISIGLHDIIKEFIDNLGGKFHHNKDVVHKVLGLIKASKDGLSEKEILDILSRDEEILKSLEQFNTLTLCIDGNKIRRFPVSVWVRLYDQLKPFLMTRLIDGQELIKFFHRQIDEVVGNYVYEENAQGLHTELANYFLTQQNREKLWDKRYNSLHMLDELPYHLFHAKDEKRLKKILFDLEFAGSIYDNGKQVGFRDILEKASQLNNIKEDEIYPWESFYREKEHLIVKADQPYRKLFQLAYEDGKDSPLFRCAEILENQKKVDWTWLKIKNLDFQMLRQGFIKVYDVFPEWINKSILELHKASENSLYIASQDINNPHTLHISTEEYKDFKFMVLFRFNKSYFFATNGNTIFIMDENANIIKNIYLKQTITTAGLFGNKIFIFLAKWEEDRYAVDEDDNILYDEYGHKVYNNYLGAKCTLLIYDIITFMHEGKATSYELEISSAVNTLCFANDNYILFKVFENESGYENFYYLNLKNLKQKICCSSGGDEYYSFLYADDEIINFSKICITADYVSNEYIYTICLPAFTSSSIKSEKFNEYEKINTVKNNNLIELSKDVFFKVTGAKLFFYKSGYSQNNNKIEYKVLPNKNILILFNKEIHFFDYEKCINLGKGRELPTITKGFLKIGERYFDLNGKEHKYYKEISKYYILNYNYYLEIKNYIPNENEEDYARDLDKNLFIDKVSIYNKNLLEENIVNIYPKEAICKSSWKYLITPEMVLSKRREEDFLLLIEDIDFGITDHESMKNIPKQQNSFLNDFDMTKVSEDCTLIVFWISNIEFIIFKTSLIDKIKTNCSIYNALEYAIGHYKLMDDVWIDTINYVEKSFRLVPYEYDNEHVYMIKESPLAIRIENYKYYILTLENESLSM